MTRRNKSRFLFVSYTFPPVGGAGVQRPAKFVKYLSRAGWAPVVLTAANPSVPTIDETLAAEIDDSVAVYRTRTLEPAYAAKRVVTSPKTAKLGPRLIRHVATAVLQPDPQILWLPTAVRKGLQVIQEQDLQAVVVSGPPFSSFLIGALLSRRSGIPLIVDYRDEWTLSAKYWENRTTGRSSDFLQQRLEQWVLRTASVVLATTRMSAASLAEACRACGSSARVEHIYNGYDPEDFPEELGPRQPEKFVLAYVGTLWNLTSIEPLVTAVRKLLERMPEAVRMLEVSLAGRITESQQPLVDSLKATGVPVNSYQYLAHDRAVALMRDSSAVCALLSDLPGAERVVPAKIFEYFAANRPILAIAPNGEAADILSRSARASHFRPSDTQGIVDWLQRSVSGATGPPNHATDDMGAFRRDVQALALGSMIDDAISAEAHSPVGGR